VRFSQRVIQAQPSIIDKRDARILMGQLFEILRFI